MLVDQRWEVLLTRFHTWNKIQQIFCGIFFKKQFFFYTGSLCFLTLTQNVSRKKNVFLRYFFSSSEWKKKKVKSFVFVLFSGFICLFIQDFFFYYKTFFSQEFCVYFSVDKNKFNSVLHKKYEETFFHQIFLHIVWKKGWKSLKYIFFLLN